MATILSISLPAGLRDTLDAEAKRQRRSRSYVVSEAIREYVARQQQGAFAEGGSRTLREALATTAAERIQLSEELWRELAWGRRPVRPRAASFDTFDAYERWQSGRSRKIR
jgi:predicted transcriptional regulator